MREIRTSGSMSGDWNRSLGYRASLRLYSVHEARGYARRHKAESLPAPLADCPQRAGQPGLCGGSGAVEDLNAGVWRDALFCTDRVMPDDAGTDHRTGARQSTPTLFSATPVLSPSG